ncbi:MAG: hypothetical protein R6X17_08435 [Candidatus Competibacteraceae bacterium]
MARRYPLAAGGGDPELPDYNEKTSLKPGGRRWLKRLDWALAGLLTVARRR